MYSDNPLVTVQKQTKENACYKELNLGYYRFFR